MNDSDPKDPAENTKDADFFEKFGLEISHGEVEIGGTYPIYGMITKIISEDLGNVIVELNFSIEAKLHIDNTEKLEIIKQRAFEPGIFVSSVVAKDPKVSVECSTVVFGRRQNTEEQ